MGQDDNIPVFLGGTGNPTVSPGMDHYLRHDGSVVKMGTRPLFGPRLALSLAGGDLYGLHALWQHRPIVPAAHPAARLTTSLSPVFPLPSLPSLLWVVG